MTDFDERRIGRRNSSVRTAAFRPWLALKPTLQTTRKRHDEQGLSIPTDVRIDPVDQLASDIDLVA